MTEEFAVMNSKRTRRSRLGFSSRQAMELPPPSWRATPHFADFEVRQVYFEDAPSTLRN